MTDATRGAIDCDVHVSVPSTKVLLPYLDEHWREHVEVRGIEDLELMYAVHGASASCRSDWRPEAGKPAASLDDLRRHVLDAFGPRYAIANVLWGAGVLHAEDLSSALCRAVNDWIAAEWLDPEPRLRASITVPLEFPGRAAEEIERRSGDPRFVQVLLLAMGEAPLGKKRYWPIFEAAERHKLPIGIHAGTSYRHAPTMSGWPSHHVEDYVAQAAGMQSQLLSLVFEGVFAKFPSLSVVLLESGVTWLPGFLWRADKTWRGLRMEVPWLRTAPSELVRRHVRMTLRPLDAPSGAEVLEKIVGQIGSDEMLLFSTDYPHWRFEDDDAVPDGILEPIRDRMMSENALATYPRLSEAMR